MTIFDKAVEIEQHLFRDRWLMVKTLMADLSPDERYEAIDLIREHSTRVTGSQLRQVTEMADNDDFLTVL